MKFKLAWLAIFLIGIGASRCAAQFIEEIEHFEPRVKWRAEIGSGAGPIAVAKEHILVGVEGAWGGGRMQCLTRSGKRTWHADHAKLPERQNGVSQGIHSRPFVKEDRVYYYSNRGEIVCADLDGFFDGENDGPFQDEPSALRENVDIVWKVDLIGEYGVFKRDAHDIGNPHPSILIEGDTLYCITGNGARNEGKGWFAPSPLAPSLIALDVETGLLRWSFCCDAKRIRLGQWGSPSLFKNGAGANRLAFAGGDAILYSLDPASGKVDWEAELEPAGGKGFCSGRPCFWEDLILVGLGRECDSSEPYSIVAVSREGKIAWRFTHPTLAGCIGSLVVKDGVAFAYSNTHVLYAIDARTGALHAHHQPDDSAGLFLSPVLSGDRVLVSSPSGVYEFTADKNLTPIRFWNGCNGENDPVIVGREIFVASGKELVCAEWESSSK